MSIEHAMNKKLQIHNSTAEFLIFQIENKEEGIEVLYQDESLWLTQDAIAVLFDKSRSTITEHLQNIFQSQELQEDSVCRKFGDVYKRQQLNITSLPFAAMSLIRKDLRNTVSFKTVYSNPILINTRQITFLILITK